VGKDTDHNFPENSLDLKMSMVLRLAHRLMKRPLGPEGHC
jgi:hypothetical protein